MLRDHRYGDKQCFCWQNRVQEIDDEAQPEGEDESRDLDSQEFKSQECREIP